MVKMGIPLNKTVCASNFCVSLMMELESKWNYILFHSNLLSQFLVDVYAKIETERLSFIRNIQKEWWTENNIHLQDAIKNSQISELSKTVLPSSSTGWPRYINERTQDAMTYVHQFGNLDLFITFTCNPK